MSTPEDPFLEINNFYEKFSEVFLILFILNIHNAISSLQEIGVDYIDLHGLFNDNRGRSELKFSHNSREN